MTMRERTRLFTALATVGGIAILWLLVWRPTVTYSDLYDQQPCFAVLEPVGDATDIYGEPDSSSDPERWSEGDQERLHIACERIRTRNSVIAALLITPTLLLGQAAWTSRSKRGRDDANARAPRE